MKSVWTSWRRRKSVSYVCALRVLWRCISKWFLHDVSKQRGSVIFISILEVETTMMFRNVGRQSPNDAALRARITETPTEPQQKPKTCRSVSVRESFPSVSCSQQPLALLTAFTLSGSGVKGQYVGSYCWLKRLGWAIKLQWWFTGIYGIHNKLLNLRSAGTESLMVYSFTLISSIYAVPSEKRGGVDCFMTHGVTFGIE